MDVYSLRLTDGTILQIRGERYGVDGDLYPGAASRYRAAFRLICGNEVQTNARLYALEVALWDEEAGSLIYSFGTTGDTLPEALAALDQFDPCAYLPRGHLQPNDLPEIRTRYDERARRFRDEALQFFA
jgi:hypothetical protein